MVNVIIKNIELGWNEDLSEEQWTVTFDFDLKGDHYEGYYVYCAGNEYESVREVSVTLDGVQQYQSGHYDDVTQEWVDFTGTYLSRVLPEDWWDESFIYEVLNPIWAAREGATKVAMGALIGAHVKETLGEEI